MAKSSSWGLLAVGHKHTQGRYSRYALLYRRSMPSQAAENCSKNATMK